MPHRSLPVFVLAVALLALLPTTAASAEPAVRLTVAPFAADAPAKTRVVVRNVAQRRLAGLTLKLRAPKGVRPKVKGGRKLPALAPGAKVRKRVVLRGGTGAPASGALRVAVTRKGKALAAKRVRFGPTGPPPNPNTLAGRYFWGSNYTINGTDQLPMYFTDDAFVFTGEITDAWPSCPAASEDCLPYTYDAKTRALTVNGLPATFDEDGFELDGQPYFELGYPEAGARWDTTVTYANSSGLCPLYCSYYREDLTFLPDGTFVRDSVSSGTGPVVDWAVVPDDRKGTYEVRPDRTLRLAYADGTERIDTVALFRTTLGGPLQAPGEGVVLDGEGYFDIRD